MWRRIKAGGRYLRIHYPWLRSHGLFNKQMFVMLVSVTLIFGTLFGYIFFKNLMMKRYLKSAGMPAVTVSTLKVEYQDWQPEIKATGSVTSILGVEVTTSIGGMVKEIYFVPGAIVKKDQLLLSLNDDTEVATLHALQASAELAKTVYERDKAQYAINAVSKATLDFDIADLKNKEAQADAQAAIVEKKKIAAPFDGRLGISPINPGQYLNPGDRIITLQSLDPIYVDFFIPQQKLKDLKVGQEVSLTVDTFGDEKFMGRISTIEPKVDVDTRNVKVQAILKNPNNKLLPGMFGSVAVLSGSVQQFLTLPQAAISFNPYGEIVYVVTEDTGNDKRKNKEKPRLIANEVFVKTGERRGDQIAILQGIKEGDTIVTSGQLKLRNGSEIMINNSIQPSNNPNPRVMNE